MEKQHNFYDLSAHLRLLLETESYSRSTVRDMEFILSAFADFMAANDLESYTPEIGDCLVQYCEQDLQVCASRVTRAKVIVRKLNRLYQGLDGRAALWGDRTSPMNIPDGLSDSLNAYITHCRKNGNKETTIHYRQWICGKFLQNLAELGCTKIEDASGELIQSAFLKLGCSRYWDRIGPFLRFLFESRFLAQDYSNLILHRRSHTPHPTVYSTEEISVVEDSVDRNSPSGIRNFAIILLLSRYGIRACDIAALSFENIDFQNNRIHFTQQKTGDPWESELFPEVKAALQDYIQNVRPHVPGCSQIFITLMIPYKPIDSFAINTMVWDLFGKSDVAVADRRHGSRAFRSSIASNMINDRVPTEVVRRVLGHGTKHALKHYAKIDVESMRLCPLPVPEPSGSFAQLLSWKAGEDHV